MKNVIGAPNFDKTDDTIKANVPVVAEKKSQVSSLKDITLGLGMDLFAHFEGQTIYKGHIPFNVSKDEQIKLNVGWLAKIAGKRDYAKISIQEFRVRLLGENKQPVSLVGTKMLDVPGEAELYEKYEVKSDSKSKISWSDYYNQVVKFKYRIELNGYTVWKMPKDRTIHICKSKVLESISEGDTNLVTVKA